MTTKSRVLKENTLSHKHIPFFSLLLVSWVITFYEGIVTAAKVWYVSEIFHHCAFVIPGSLYLIYRQRDQFSKVAITPTTWMLFPLLGCGLLYAVGKAGDIKLFMHAATFISLPVIIAAAIGMKLAARLLYPLLFMLFAIPIGEELVPALQQVTANLAVQGLQWSDVPIFRSGLYIQIPQGQFLVAEACSGISFFIASIVIGSLYAHLNISKLSKKIIFIVISILFPIIANAIRVYGIVLTAYLTDMEYAAGADHLIYGGVFFSMVIICLLLLGELFRDAQETGNQNAPNKQEAGLIPIVGNFKGIGLLLLAGFLMLNVWTLSIKQTLANSNAHMIIQESSFSMVELSSKAPKHNWLPVHERATQKFYAQLDEYQIDLFMAWYPAGGEGELISSLNKPYAQEDWTIVSKQVVQLDGAEFELHVITSPNGQNRMMAHWFNLDDQSLANKTKTKLIQTFRTLIGEQSNGAYIAISKVVDPQIESAQQKKFIETTEKIQSEFAAWLGSLSGETHEF